MPASTSITQDAHVPEAESVAREATRSLSKSAFALILNTGATSVLGAIFWVVAGRLYSPTQLGEDAALISAMMLLAAVAELNFGLALPRFLPQLGKRSPKAVLMSYALSSAAAVVITGITVVVIPNVFKSLSFLGGSFALAVLLWVSVVLWNIFALQDAVLTALRRAVWIPIENAIFGVAKIALMVIWAGSTVKHGVYVAWVVPMAVMIIPVNIALFKWALPRHVATSEGGHGLFWGEDGRKKVIRYLSLDYCASLLIQGATTLTPLLVVVLLGAKQNGYFYVAFTVSSSMDQLAHNVGLSLTVESAFDESQLARLTRHTFARFGVLLGVGVTVVVITAPWLLWCFGHHGDYSNHATTVLRLLALGTIPQTVLNLYQAVERVRGHAGRILAITAGRFACIVCFIVLLAKPYGLAGVGWGWIAGHLIVMAFAVPPLYRLMRKP